MVKWRGTAPELSVDDLLARPPARPGRRDDERTTAAQFLERQLEGGPQAKSVILMAAEQRGISAMTLRRAAEKLEIIKFKKGKISMWRLP